MDTNKHHILYQYRHYKTGYGRKLRDALVFDLDTETHKNLHNYLVDIPEPSDNELKEVWEVYQKHKKLVRSCDILTVCEWLASMTHDTAFRGCMYRQYMFLKSRLGG